MNIVKSSMQLGAWASYLFALTLALPSFSQDLPTAKPEDVGVSPEKVAELSEFMQSLVDEGNIAGGVTMMARHGKVIHLKAVGMADRDEKKPMTTDAIFRIACMTRAVTSVAVMMLYEQGKLELDEPVSKYVPDFPTPQVLVSVSPWRTERANGPITIRQLLTHTSGLATSFHTVIGPTYQSHGIQCGISIMQMDLKETMTALAKIPLVWQPGERWEYSISTDLLGYVIETISGMPLDRFIESHVCQPLDMNDTHFQVPTEKVPRLVAAYVPGDTCLHKVGEGETLQQRFSGGLVTLCSDYCYGGRNKYLSGVAGLCSTANDYMRFCQMLLNGGELNGVRLLKSETVEMMTTNQVGDLYGEHGFGLGFAIYPNTDTIPTQLRSSYQWAGGWTTYFLVAPKGDWILICMAQRFWDGERASEWLSESHRIAAESIQ